VSRAPFLHVRGVRKRFGPTVALDGVDLDVAAGEVHGLLGENGAGKSTLMKVLSGALAPDEGEILLDGRPHRPRSPVEGRAQGVGMIYQELSLAPHLSVAENVLLGAEPTKGPFVDRRELVRRARAALERVGRPDLPLHTPVARLGPGERQLVEIARTVALGSRLFVFDEPTSSLTRADVEHLFRFIRSLRDEGRAVVYISHALEEVAEICDRYTVLRDGRTVATGGVDEFDVDRIVAAMVGREVRELYPRSTRRAGEVLLEASDLAGEPLPRDASLTLHAGEVLGIFGLVGAGRTELLRALFGLDAIASGRIRVGVVEGAATPDRRWAQGVGFVSEDRAGEGLAPDLSIAENVCLPEPASTARAGIVSPAAEARAARTWIERLGIRCRSPHQRVTELSGGNQQKVALARLLAAGCRVLLLDEPTRGVDVAAKAEIYRWIDELARGDAERPACAILVVSSYLPELLGVCDRVAVLRAGRLGPARPVAECDEHTLLREATLEEAIGGVA